MDISALFRDRLQRLDRWYVGGAATGLGLLTLYHILSEAGSEPASRLAGLLLLALAISPLVIAHRHEKMSGEKIFRDFKDFSLTVIWVPAYLITAMFITDNTGFQLLVTMAGFLADAFSTAPGIDIARPGSA